MNFLKIIHEKEFFRNESWRNLKNVLQRSLRIDRAKEFIFRVSGTMVVPLWVLCVYWSAQKNSEYATDKLQFRTVKHHFFKKTDVMWSAAWN